MKRLYKLSFLILLIGCEQNEVESRFKEALTIEGYVEYNQPVKVYLTSNFPFQGTITEDELLEAEEGRAKVTVSDGITNEVLTLTRDNDRYPSIVYKSLEGMKGVVGRDYELKVSLKGKEYTATTKVPNKPEVISSEVIEDNKGGRSVDLKLKNIDGIQYFKLLVKNEVDENYVWADPNIFTDELVDNNKDIRLVVNFDERIDGVTVNQFVRFENYDIKLVAISKAEYDFFKSVYGDQTTLLPEAGFGQDIKTSILGENDVFGFWAGENVFDFKVIIN